MYSKVWYTYSKLWYMYTKTWNIKFMTQYILFPRDISNAASPQTKNRIHLTDKPLDKFFTIFYSRSLPSR